MNKIFIEKFCFERMGRFCMLYGDGPIVEPFLRYKGLLYDVGTRLRFNAYSYGFYCGVKEGVIEKFINNHMIIKVTEGETYSFCTTKNLVNFDKEIIEIIEPVYWVPDNEEVVDDSEKPAPWDVEIGCIWYILIMAVGFIFKEGVLIWAFATAVFFLWKSGKFNKK